MIERNICKLTLVKLQFQCEVCDTLLFQISKYFMCDTTFIWSIYLNWYMNTHTHTYTMVNERLSANDRLIENGVAQHSVRVTIKRNAHEPKHENELEDYMLYDYIHKFCRVLVRLYMCVHVEA